MNLNPTTTSGGYNAGYIAPKKKKVKPTVGPGGYSAGYVAPKTETAYSPGYIPPKENVLQSSASNGGYNAGYIQSARTATGLQPTFGSGYKAGYIEPGKVTMKTATGGGILNERNPYDENGIMSFIAEDGDPPPPIVEDVVVEDDIVVEEEEEVDDGFKFSADRGGVSPNTVSLPDGTQVSMTVDQWDSGGWRQFSHLTPEERINIRKRLVQEQGVQAPTIVGASGGIGNATATAAPVDGLGNQVKQASQGAALYGFDDPNVRRSQENLVRQILDESEELGQQAANNLDLPTFERSPLEGTLETFLMGQLNQGFDGNDPLTQANIADFDANAEDARRQQIEDLQRYGVLGDGVSAGFTADVLGGFDADVLRGRGALQAEGQRNLLNSILPNAQSLAQFQGGQQSRNREFEANYNLDRLNAQQDVANQSQARRMALTDPTGLQVFQESVRQANLGNERADRGLDMQLAQLLGVTEDGRQTLGAQQLGQQDRQFLASLGLDERRLDQQGSQFDRQLSQQDRQFLASLGLDERRLAEMSRQFDASNALAEGSLLGRYNGQDTLARDQVDLQNSQFLQDLGFRNRSLNIQDENADRDRNQRGSMFQQELQQSDRQFLAQLGLSERQIDLLEAQQQQQAEGDRIARILAAREAGFENLVTGTNAEQLLAELLGIPYNNNTSTEDPDSDGVDPDALVVGDTVTGDKAVGANDIVSKNGWVNVMVGDNEITTQTGQTLARWDNDAKVWKKA